MTRRRSRIAAVVSAVVIVFSGSLLPVVATSTTASAATAKVLTPAQIRAAKPSTLFPGGLAVQPDTTAAQMRRSLLASGKKAEAAGIGVISTKPVAVWLGDWYSDTQVKTAVTKALAAADAAGRTATFVTYAIPDRDCGDYSAGGLTADEYGPWNTAIASALRGHRAAVIVEPDALAMLSSCPAGTADVRLPLIRSAVTTLAKAGATVYIDAGNSHWVAPATMADRLKQAGIAGARGFSTNVSNFYPTADEKKYGNAVSALTGGSHYVIDTSRNGQGWKGTWCNPAGAGLGTAPRVASGKTKADALLWVKTPGASDGTCNGGPAAGAWWESYAVALVRNRVR